LLIKEVLDFPSGSAILYTRPRRFGKSLNASMLKTYFDIAENSEKYFVNKEIYKLGNEYLKEMNKYPVISISFKNISGINEIEAISKYKQYISKIYLDYKKDIYESLNEESKITFDNYANKTIEDVLFSDSLYDLTKLLYEHYNKKVIIIIDEYDNPLEIAFDEGYYDKIHIFYKNLFSKVLKGNDYLKYGIIFGVMEVTKGSLFSGLNNLYVNTLINNNNDEFFGFSYEDTYNLLSQYKKENMLDEIKKWYGGYVFSNKKIFNPWSILNFIKLNFTFDLYWINTSTNLLIENLLNENASDILTYLSSLLKGETVVKNINLNLNYSEIKNSEEALFSFLVLSGYLCVLEKISVGKYVLGIPNLEINELFKKEIIDKFQRNNSYLEISYYLKKAILTNNPEEIKNIFEKYLLTNLSYYDFSYEKNYQIFLLTLISLLFNDYHVESEVNSGYGRLDLMIESKNNELGIVIEIKHSKSRLSNERFENLASTALRQVESNDYISNYNIQKQKHIIIYGIAFYKNKVCIKSKIIK